ncbi:uncharacterized protein SAPINGB_P004742 [Magnusiomyces paraingens]|uniref:Conserved oligomeric Golgi complex subunit 8 n=1 Tax=Magnusiomyces paraingens TaxID=2606893 RepID=A0A5E8C3Q8_9ASCO|nr:uncharacterized protein SAPINGB_P004742 [Saprochaete ingens]VVT55795.1 unnamed protein product [Saprochaete ingens]
MDPPDTLRALQNDPSSSSSSSSFKSLGDPLLDLLVPTLPKQTAASVVAHAPAARASVARLRASSLDAIMATSLDDQLAAESQVVNGQLARLTHAAYPQLLQSAGVVDSLLAQFAQFEKTAAGFYDAQLAYIDQEMHHYLGLSTAVDGEKLGGYTANSAGSTEKPRRRSSTGIDDNNVGSIEPPAKNAEDAVIVLKNLEKIQDILELPNLVLACVNNGYYAEALDLAAHSARLSKRYNQVHIVQNIQAQVDDALKTMTVQLLQLLRESVKLPTLIKVVSYLRRLPPFARGAGESISPAAADSITRQLQELFLFSRLQYIRGLLSSLDPIKKQSPDAYLKRYVEVFRENVFVTVVGFRSVFPDHADPLTPTTASQFSGSLLVSSFIKALVEEFYTTVAEIAPFIDDENARSSLWLQISYCSKSLGRVGADFWPTVQGPEDQSGPDGALSKAEWIAAIQKQLDISKHYSTTAVK